MVRDYEWIRASIESASSEVEKWPAWKRNTTMVDKWKELSPERRLMLETLIEHDGVSEYSAALSFKRGDISWAQRRKLVGRRSFMQHFELYVTDAGRELVAPPRSN